jgi:hypothetical protein
MDNTFFPFSLFPGLPFGPPFPSPSHPNTHALLQISNLDGGIYAFT